MERQDYDSMEFKSNVGKVRNVNIKKNKNYKLTNTLHAALITTAVLVSIFTGCGVSAMKKNQESSKPSMLQEAVLSVKNEDIKIFAEVPIERGDNVSTFAELYYREEYASIYKDVREYEKAIISENNLNSDGFIIAGGTLKIPVIIKMDDPYYINYQRTLSNLENYENTWVRYVVSYGDTLWKLASQSCVEDGDIVNTIEQIKERNNLGDGNLSTGIEIMIKNPELKKLKQAVIDARELFNESLLLGNAKVMH